MLVKTCISCKIEKPKNNEFFSYRNKKRGWFASWCKDCRVKKRKETWGRELIKQRERRGNLERMDVAPKPPKINKPCRGCGTHDKGAKKRYCELCAKTVLVELRRDKKRKDKCIYKSRLRKAMPTWADRLKIREFYKSRPEGCHVDHIVPIRGELVSGLHVHYNLQYLTAEDNMSKGNHYSMEHNGVM